MARYAEDLRPLLKIMAGAKVHALNLDEKVSERKLKYFMLMK